MSRIVWVDKVLHYLALIVWGYPTNTHTLQTYSTISMDPLQVGESAHVLFWDYI